jgi:hypothetical protein
MRDERLVETFMTVSTKTRNRSADDERLLAERFEQLARKWDEETLLLSSHSRIRAHPAFEAIVQMGDDAIPLLLAKLKNPSMTWFIALSAIVGGSPVSQAHAGKIQEMASDWLAWGKEHGYLG